MARRVALLAVFALLAGAAGLPRGARAVPFERGRDCGSPAGVWRARTDRPGDGLDEIITVTLTGSGPRFTGRATTDYWYGPPGGAPPVACGTGVVHRVLEAPMTAELAGRQLSWWVSDPSQVFERVICGLPSTAGHSSGRTVGQVDLVAGVFDGYFDVSISPGRVRYLHVGCTSP